jgi:hypothetical protein
VSDPFYAISEPVWTHLQLENAQLMLAEADEPVVLFYLYFDNEAAKRCRGCETEAVMARHRVSVSGRSRRVRLTDPDGYALMVTHT